MCGLMATTAAILIASVICECFQPAANQMRSDQNYVLGIQVQVQECCDIH